MLEIDRAGEVPIGAEHIRAARLAFHDERPKGAGQELDYSAFSAFALGLALEIMDAGFKQAEVGFFLRYMRSSLESEFARALTYPPHPRSPIAAENMPDVPVIERNGIRFADPRIFMILERVELVERLTASRPGQQGAIILEPEFCWGFGQLTEILDQLGYNRRRAIVLEIAQPAVRISELLKQAPQIRRGRKGAGGRST